MQPPNPAEQGFHAYRVVLVGHYDPGRPAAADDSPLIVEAATGSCTRKATAFCSG